MAELDVRMCGEQVLVRSLSSPRKRRSYQIMAENGHAATGKRGRSMGKEMGILFDLEGQKKHQICSFMRADKFWIASHSKSHLEQMLGDPIQEAERWDLAPKQASLWWTRTDDSEEKTDLSIDTKTGRHRFPFEIKIKILGCSTNRQGKTHEGLEERMQSAN